MQSKKFTAFSHIILMLNCIVVFVPIFIVVMLSVSNEQDILDYGYKVIPMHIDFSAYKLIFEDIVAVAKATGISLFSSIVSPALVVILCGTIGYALSQPKFAYRKYVLRYILVTMLFSGGLIPSYIINTQYLGLYNNILVHAVLGLVGGSNIILFKTFFSQIPASLIEAAEIDGASQKRIFVSIILPMSKPIVASIFFSGMLGHWNDYSRSLYYISDKNLFDLQYFLQNALQSASFLKQTYANNPSFANDAIPVETLKFALSIISCLPVVLIFPYIQKFYSKGMAVGAVKE